MVAILGNGFGISRQTLPTPPSTPQRWPTLRISVLIKLPQGSIIPITQLYSVGRLGVKGSINFYTVVFIRSCTVFSLKIHKDQLLPGQFISSPQHF